MSSIRRHFSRRLIREVKSRGCPECNKPLFTAQVYVTFDGGLEGPLPDKVGLSITCGWCESRRSRELTVDDAMRRDVAASYREDGEPIDDDEVERFRKAMAGWTGDFKGALG